MRRFFFYFLCLMLISCFFIYAEEKKEAEKKDPLSSSTFMGLKFRSIGPAFSSGRISDFAVNPYNNMHYILITLLIHPPLF